MKNNKYIAKNIILAQIASDGGKGYIERGDYILSTYGKKGYQIKDNSILNAIRTINKSKSSDFYYYVKESKRPWWEHHCVF